MTFLEKAMKEHPELSGKKIIIWMCPCDLGEESMEDGCNQDGTETPEVCAACWNREVPEHGV